MLTCCDIRASDQCLHKRGDDVGVVSGQKGEVKNDTGTVYCMQRRVGFVDSRCRTLELRNSSWEEVYYLPTLVKVFATWR